MRIATLNTWKNEGDYPRRLRLMAEGLRALQADVICLQECFAGGGHDTALYLALALNLAASVRPARAKARRHDGGMIDSTSGLAVLSRAPVLAESMLPLPSHEADGERIAQRVDLEAQGLRLRILNLHLTHLRGPAFAVLRGRQLKEALAWALGTGDVGLVVGGDLNAPATAPELGPLNTAGSLALPTMLGPAVSYPAPHGPAIDHLLLQVPGGWRADQIFRALDQPDAEGWFASDHAAVVLDLSPAA